MAYKSRITALTVCRQIGASRLPSAQPGADKVIYTYSYTRREFVPSAIFLPLPGVNRGPKNSTFHSSVRWDIQPALAVLNRNIWATLTLVKSILVPFSRLHQNGWHNSHLQLTIDHHSTINCPFQPCNWNQCERWSGSPYQFTVQATSFIRYQKSVVSCHIFPW